VTPPFDFSGGSKVAPVQLPEAGFDAEEGISGTIAGWGQPTVKGFKTEVNIEITIKKPNLSVDQE